MPALYRLLLTLAIGLGSLSPVCAQELRLNEILASNHGTLADEDGDHPDWIELYNAGTTTLNLAGYGLSDDPDDPFRFVLSDRALAPGSHTLVFASGKDRPGDADTHPHTSFRLDADGETLTLTTPDGARLDEITFETLPPNVAYGRAPDGADTWAFFDEPTPNAPNPSSGATEIAPAPTASHPGGRYDGSLTVTLAAPGTEDAIHYTLDGSPPTPEAPRYTEPLTFEETTVLRAQVVRPGHLPGPVLTNTYLLDEDVHLPVVALATTPANLWDEETGIYVLGPNASPGIPHFGANFWEDWEIPVHVEFFEPGAAGTVYELDAGASIFGGWSRSNPQKSLAIFARNRYGADAIHYPLFANRAINEYQAFVLRNAGNDWFYTLFRDGLMQSLVEGTGVDILAYRPAALFINGASWGIQNIREKVNEHYIASHHDVDPDAIDMLEIGDPPRVLHGSRTHYMQFLEYLEQQDITSEQDFEVVESLIDVDNFIDYQVAQIFFVNTDWPGNNLKFWRPQTPEGRWRWILYDTDFGFGLYRSCGYGEEQRQEGRDPVPCEYHETLDFATYADGTEWPNPAYSTFELRRLLENPTFRDAFINRFADHLNHTFTPERMLARIEAMQEAIAPEVPRHLARWERDPTSWGRSVEGLREFARRRTDFMWTHLRDFFDLPDTTSVTLASNPPGAGTLRINRLDVDAEHDTWMGHYFPGVPVELHARPHPGYRFAGWSGDVESSNPQIVVDPATASTITAHFEVNPNDPRGIVLNEVLYQPSSEADSGDWVELTNLHATPLSLAGWTFRDDDSHGFVLPPGTEIEAQGYLVLCRDPEAFAEVYEQPCLGGWDFGLSSSGDMLRLYDAGGVLVDSVRYENAAPWPTVVEGSGHTLELADVMLENSDPDHWRASQQPRGTPGSLNSTSTPGMPAPEPPTRFALVPNYPNPFQEATTIAYELAQQGRVVLRVYDVLGREVRTLVNAAQPAGTYTVRFEAQGLAGGVYFYRLETEQGMHTRSMLLVR